jgi:hypothetical protein
MAAVRLRCVNACIYVPYARPPVCGTRRFYEAHGVKRMYLSSLFCTSTPQTPPSSCNTTMNATLPSCGRIHRFTTLRAYKRLPFPSVLLPAVCTSVFSSACSVCNHRRSTRTSMRHLRPIASRTHAGRSASKRGCEALCLVC